MSHLYFHKSRIIWRLCYFGDSVANGKESKFRISKRCLYPFDEPFNFDALKVGPGVSTVCWFLRTSSKNMIQRNLSSSFFVPLCR